VELLVFGDGSLVLTNEEKKGRLEKIREARISQGRPLGSDTMRQTQQGPGKTKQKTKLWESPVDTSG